jgi:GxxExxY protein
VLADGFGSLLENYNGYSPQRAQRAQRTARGVMAEERDSLSYVVLGAAITVHREMGPGLLESVYQACLANELSRAGVPFSMGVEVPLVYRGTRLDSRLRLDILVDAQLVLELKSVEKLAPIHSAQLLSYLRLTGHRRGLLLNFNVPRLTDGVVRFVL